MALDKIGKVTVLANLGTGAQSSIVKVRREADGREYALKVVPIETEDDKKYLQQAKHEYRVAQMLDHPSCVKIFCLETESDWFFRVRKAKLLVEYVPGETLDKVKLLNHAKLLRTLERVASGVAHMHKQGVLHADLKPSNIMLGRGTHAKILDYGLAWIKGEPKDRVQGTPEYMAPETASRKIVNERTDIYNFGATMYRLVTFSLPPCVLPVEGLRVKEATFHELLKPVKELSPGCPDGLAVLIERCLSYNALNRPERMSEVQGTLDRLADEYAAKLTDPDEIER